MEKQALEYLIGLGEEKERVIFTNNGEYTS